tara:strand:- start:213 stop:692 length:480 start_codon:yes stop_codon:yes gene_type:complete
MGDFVNIKNYETYGISRDGDIKDLRTGKLMKQWTSPDGYKKINLRNPADGQKCLLVHRLVAIQFIDNENNKPEVDHIDRNRTNNNIDNLRWVDDYEQSHNRGDFKNSQSGHKYIWYEECCNSYVFCITRNHKKHRKRFNAKNYTLEDVLKYKEDYIQNH